MLYDWKKISSMCALTLSVAFLSTSAAQAEGHYTPGVEGVQAASVPPPGFYLASYLVNYRMKSFRKPGSSSDLPGDNTGNVAAWANRFVWMTGAKFLGADYGVETIVPMVRTSLSMDAGGVDESHSGIGDIFLGPVILAWHGERWDIATGAGVWLDNARHNRPADPGKGYKSWMLSAGGTYYFDEQKTWSASTLFRFEKHFDSATAFTPGNQLSMEWGLGKRFGLWQAGLVGYSQWQLSDDSGPGATDKHFSKHAVGAELSYAFPAYKAQVKLAAYNEVSVKAGSSPEPKGNLFRLTFLKSF